MRVGHARDHRQDDSGQGRGLAAGHSEGGVWARSHVATPLRFRFPLPKEVLPSRNVIVPLEGVAAEELTVAVNVTDDPNTVGLPLVANDVEVGAGLTV